MCFGGYVPPVPIPYEKPVYEPLASTLIAPVVRSGPAQRDVETGLTVRNLLVPLG